MAPHEALGGGLANMEAFTQHVTQMTDELRRVQHQHKVERHAALKEKNDVEAKWLQRLRVARVASALRAGLAARDLRAAGRVLRLWVGAVRILQQEALAQRKQREQRLQLELRDSGRARILAERTSLGKQASASACAAQQLRAALSSRSQELERTIVRDAMAFELWAADALRTKKVLEAVQTKRADTDAAAVAEALRLRDEVQLAKEGGKASRTQAECAVAATLGGELAQCEAALRVRAVNQAVVVSLCVQHSTLQRFWRIWAAVASLLLREAGGALLQLELSKQQQNHLLHMQGLQPHEQPVKKEGRRKSQPHN